MRTCPRCKEIKSFDEFYKRRDSKKPSPYCKICTNEQTLERQREFKLKCISYKGGSCVKCGYSRCPAALEFHHIKPEHKDFSLSHARLTGFTDVIKAELDKCILVCCRCHREIHAGILTPVGFEPTI